MQNYNYQTPKDSKEVDVFNRFSRHNKLKVVLIAIAIVIVSSVAIFFFSKSLYTYTIRIVADGGTLYGEPLQEEYKYKFLQRTKLPEGLKKEGYYIAGFYTDSEFKDEYKFGSRIWSSKTIYIDWQPGYAVQLHFVNGEDTEDRPELDKTGIDETYLKNYYEQYVKPDSEFTIPDVYNHVEKNEHYGEKLLWYDNPSGVGEPISNEAFKVSSNIKVYGKWFDVQEFKFDVDENGVLQRYLGTCANVILPDSIKGIKDIEASEFIDGIWDTSKVVNGRNYSAFDKVAGKLKTLYINENFENLGTCSFRSCTALENIKFLGNKITAIPDNCFQSCTGLKSLVLPSSITYIGDYAFSKVLNMKSITGTENVLEIGICAFVNCEELEYIYLDSLDTIHKNAFASCLYLKEVYLGNTSGVVLASDIDSPSDNLFYGALTSSSELKITVPNSALVLYYQTAEYWNVYATRFVVKE